jgi:hypothetical protein
VFKKIFKDDERIIGLSGFKKAELPKQIYKCAPKLGSEKVVFGTNYNKNIFVN